MQQVSDGQLLGLLVDAVQDYSIYLLSPTGVVTSWNAGAERIKGYQRDEIVGKHFSTFFTGDDREAGVPEAILRDATRDGRLHVQGWRVRKDGSMFWADVTVNAVLGGDGALIGFAKITRDVTDARETTLALERAATTDPLTGLLNRAAFMDELDQWTIRDGAAFSICLIDLNDFKQLNDTHGHHVGDLVLKEFAARLGSAEPAGVFARLGGDEFAAGLLHIDEAAGREFVASITSAIAPSHADEDAAHALSCSIGVAVFPGDGFDVSDLLVKADAAMYTAKERGTHTAVYFRDGLVEESASRRLLGRHIREALNRDEFELVYQTQASLHDNSVVGREALIRWNHPALGLLHPGEFISLAEANGTITALGSWALSRACNDAAAWNDSARVAVNVSAQQLSDPGFASTVEDALTASGLPADRLELEITESTLIAHRHTASVVLATLRERGVSIALDDFGTGFSSLDTLLAFPFDRVKIDRAVLHESLHPSHTRDVLRAVLALGHALTASVLVEGVELEEQRSILRNEGFDEIQGYLIGRPSRTTS